MPELPEVETVRQELESKIRTRKIQKIDLFTASMVKNETKEFRKSVLGSSIEHIYRIGKLLQFYLDNGQIMLAHLKMTGQFLFREQGRIKAGVFPLLYASTPGAKKTVGQFQKKQEKKEWQDKHTHIIFHFEDGSQLAFRDQRKFGYIKLIDADEVEAVNARYGIDPLHKEFTVEAFQKTFSRRKKSIKALLMDQQLIAGLGNIYTDEICHRVGIKPQRSVSSLNMTQQKQLYYATCQVIQTALQHKGTTFRDFARTDGNSGGFAYELRVYGRENVECLQCENGKIKKVQYLGRGTHYCTKCQK